MFGSIGAALVPPGGQLVQCFGERVPSSLVQSLLAFTDQPIYEIQVLHGLASPPSHETLDAIFHMLSNRSFWTM